MNPKGTGKLNFARINEYAVLYSKGNREYNHWPARGRSGILTGKRHNEHILQVEELDTEDGQTSGATRSRWTMVRDAEDGEVEAPAEITVTQLDESHLPFPAEDLSWGSPKPPCAAPRWRIQLPAPAQEPVLPSIH